MMTVVEADPTVPGHLFSLGDLNLAVPRWVCVEPKAGRERNEDKQLL